MTVDLKKPSRRQIVLNWVMGEDDLTQPGGYWTTSEGIAHVDELLAALDAAALEAKVVAPPAPEVRAEEIMEADAEVDDEGIWQYDQPKWYESMAAALNRVRQAHAAPGAKEPKAEV